METPSLTNIKNLLTYPFKDEKSGNKILVGSLLIVASFFIPVLPTLVVLGYLMQIAKRIIDGDEQLSLPEWHQWLEYLKDGLKWFAAILLYSLPLIIITTIGYLVYFFSFFSMIALENSSGSSFFTVFLPMFGMVVFFICLFFVFIFAIIEIIFFPVSSMHVVHTEKFLSILEINKWWPILKKNFLGFVVAAIFFCGLYYFLILVISALYMSILLCFLIPIAMAPLTFLLGLWSIPLFAQAYREAMSEPAEQNLIEAAVK